MSPEVSEVVEKRFHTTGRPLVRVENVAGETRVRGATADEVVVRATKRAYAESADRAKRVLDNIEVQFEQDGDEIRVSQRAYLLERGWANLFRDRRAVVDYEVEVPRGTTVSVRSASGAIDVRAVEGAVDLQSVSGDVAVGEVRGPLRLRTVSGDCVAERCAGVIEANAVSGDLTFRSCAWPSGRLRTLSGDVAAEVRLDGEGPLALSTVSGDVELATPSAFELRFQTTSGDLEASGVAPERLGRRAFVVRQGEGGAEVDVHTVSGDVTVRASDVDAPEAPAEDVIAAPPPRSDAKVKALEVLRAFEHGEIDADEAARRLDAVRG